MTSKRGWVSIAIEECDAVVMNGEFHVFCKLESERRVISAVDIDQLLLTLRDILAIVLSYLSYQTRLTNR